MPRYVLAPARVLRNLVTHRFLLAQLASRAFASRHAGAVLGWLWTPLGTAVQFAIYTVVFSVILEIKIPLMGGGTDLARRVPVGFGAFLITGLVPYLALNDVIMRSSRVIRANATLVQRVRLPLEVMVVGDILGTLMHHAAAVVLVVVYCLCAGHLAVAGAGWLALGIVLLVLLAIGSGLLVSVLGVAWPDIPEVLVLGLQLALYGAPIIYPLSFIKQEWLAALVQANPVTPLVGVFRAGLLGVGPPAVFGVVYLIILAAALLVVGSAVMDRYRATIPDLL
jgi:ABC-type polysaccharide/polyol phosphate export permease